MKNYEIVKVDGGYQFHIDGKPALGGDTYSSYVAATSFAFGWMRGEIAGFETKIKSASKEVCQFCRDEISIEKSGRYRNWHIIKEEAEDGFPDYEECGAEKFLQVLQ